MKLNRLYSTINEVGFPGTPNLPGRGVPADLPRHPQSPGYPLIGITHATYYGSGRSDNFEYPKDLKIISSLVGKLISVLGDHIQDLVPEYTKAEIFPCDPERDFKKSQAIVVVVAQYKEGTILHKTSIGREEFYFWFDSVGNAHQWWDELQSVIQSVIRNNRHNNKINPNDIYTNMIKLQLGREIPDEADDNPSQDEYIMDIPAEPECPICHGPLISVKDKKDEYITDKTGKIVLFCANCQEFYS